MSGPGSDLELIAAFQAGRASALEDLYWRHAGRVWRYARFFCGSEELAAEIVQESFLRVARHLARFEGRSKFSTWLYVIVRSAAIDLTTKQRKAPKPVEDEAVARVPAKTSEPLDELSAEEARTAVRSAVAKLPENEREAVILCELQEFSIREACAVLGWTESRVKVTLFRGRRRLRSILRPYVGAEART